MMPIAAVKLITKRWIEQPQIWMTTHHGLPQREGAPVAPCCRQRLTAPSRAQTFILPSEIVMYTRTTCSPRKEGQFDKSGLRCLQGGYV